MIVWSGWGYMVAILAAVGVFVGPLILNALGVEQVMADAAGTALGAVAAGIATFFVARGVEGRAGRVFIDEATNERVEVRGHAGSFFFIPTRYWSILLPVLGIALGYFMYQDPPSADAPAPAAAEAAAQPATGS